MNFKYKLSRRLAISRILWALATSTIVACTVVDIADSTADLSKILTLPTTVTLLPDESQLFSAYGITTAGDTISVPVTWNASGGDISPDGMFTALDEQGDFTVVASAVDRPQVKGSSMVKVQAALSLLVITPRNVVLLPDEGQQFVVYGRRNGDSVVVDVDYSASGGSMTDGGYYSAGQMPGTYAVVATEALDASTKNGNRKPLADTVTVTISLIPVAVVEVSPATADLAEGQTQQLTAVTRDAAGNELSGRAVTWSSSDGGVANVDDTGLVTALAEGSATVTATSESQSGTAAISVTAAGGGPLPNECANPQPGWIWCDDFDLDRLGDYFEYDDSNGDFVRGVGVGVDGSYGMRASFAASQVSAGSLHLAFGRTPQSYMRPVDDGTAEYREVYWRMYLRNQSGWIGQPDEKLSRATIFASPTSWAQAMIAHVWSGDGAYVDHLLTDPASGTDEQGNLQTTTYNDFANLRWLGAVPGATPLYDANHAGEWYCVEAHVRLNDTGQSNGVFELWIDGNLEAQSTGMNWVGAYNEYGINAVFFSNYSNSGSAQAQERYFDNIVVSTQPVGCGTVGTSPSN